MSLETLHVNNCGRVGHILKLWLGNLKVICPSKTTGFFKLKLEC